MVEVPPPPEPVEEPKIEKSHVTPQTEAQPPVTSEPKQETHVEEAKAPEPGSSKINIYYFNPYLQKSQKLNSRLQLVHQVNQQMKTTTHKEPNQVL